MKYVFPTKPCSMYHYRRVVDGRRHDLRTYWTLGSGSTSRQYHSQHLQCINEGKEKDLDVC